MFNGFCTTAMELEERHIYRAWHRQSVTAAGGTACVWRVIPINDGSRTHGMLGSSINRLSLITLSDRPTVTFPSFRASQLLVDTNRLHTA